MAERFSTCYDCAHSDDHGVCELKGQIQPVHKEGCDNISVEHLQSGDEAIDAAVDKQFEDGLPNMGNLTRILTRDIVAIYTAIDKQVEAGLPGMGKLIKF